MVNLITNACHHTLTHTQWRVRIWTRSRSTSFRRVRIVTGRSSRPTFGRQRPCAHGENERTSNTTRHVLGNASVEVACYVTVTSYITAHPSDARHTGSSRNHHVATRGKVTIKHSTVVLDGDLKTQPVRTPQQIHSHCHPFGAWSFALTAGVQQAYGFPVSVFACRLYAGSSRADGLVPVSLSSRQLSERKIQCLFSPRVPTRVILLTVRIETTSSLESRYCRARPRSSQAVLARAEGVLVPVSRFRRQLSEDQRSVLVALAGQLHRGTWSLESQYAIILDAV